MPESSRAIARVRGSAVVAVAAVGLAAGLVLTGCSKFDAALGQQWATVSFKANTSIPTMLQVRSDCDHIPNVRAEKLPKQQNQITMNGAVTYRTDNASNANLAQLQQCLQRYPSVAGIDFEDSGDDGG
ncbi:MAG TPA: hypothetical protein VMC03_18690 [Streptosporangiaceae bacterium]|nr:hypothetical protein [Streptosporangiaceae bacterium]